eukprot:g2517.t1
MKNANIASNDNAHNEKVLRRMLQGLPLTIRRQLRKLNMIKSIIPAAGDIPVFSEQKMLNMTTQERTQPSWLSSLLELDESSQLSVVSMVIQTAKSATLTETRAPYIDMVLKMKQKLLGKNAKKIRNMIMEAKKDPSNNKFSRVITVAEFKVWVQKYHLCHRGDSKHVEALYGEISARYSEKRGGITLEKLLNYLSRFKETTAYLKDADKSVSQLFDDAMHREKNANKGGRHENIVPSAWEIEQRNRIIAGLPIETRKSLRDIHDEFGLSNLRGEDTERMSALPVAVQKSVCERCTKLMRSANYDHLDHTARQVLLFALTKAETSMKSQEERENKLFMPSGVTAIEKLETQPLPARKKTIRTENRTARERLNDLSQPKNKYVPRKKKQEPWERRRERQKKQASGKRGLRQRRRQHKQGYGDPKRRERGRRRRRRRHDQQEPGGKGYGSFGEDSYESFESFDDDTDGMDSYEEDDGYAPTNQRRQRGVNRHKKQDTRHYHARIPTPPEASMANQKQSQPRKARRVVQGQGGQENPNRRRQRKHLRDSMGAHHSSVVPGWYYSPRHDQHVSTIYIDPSRPDKELDFWEENTEATNLPMPPLARHGYQQQMYSVGLPQTTVVQPPFQESIVQFPLPSQPQQAGYSAQVPMAVHQGHAMVAPAKNSTMARRGRHGGRKGSHEKIGAAQRHMDFERRRMARERRRQARDAKKGIAPRPIPPPQPGWTMGNSGGGALLPPPSDPPPGDLPMVPPVTLGTVVQGYPTVQAPVPTGAGGGYSTMGVPMGFAQQAQTFPPPVPVAPVFQTYAPMEAQVQAQNGHFNPPAQPPDFSGVILFTNGEAVAMYDSS